MPQQFRGIQTPKIAEPSIEDVGERSYQFYMRQANPQAVAATGRPSKRQIGRSAYIEKLVDQGLINDDTASSLISRYSQPQISIPQVFEADSVDAPHSLVSDIESATGTEADFPSLNAAMEDRMAGIAKGKALGLSKNAAMASLAGASLKQTGNLLAGSLAGPIGLVSTFGQSAFASLEGGRAKEQGETVAALADDYNLSDQERQILADVIATQQFEGYEDKNILRRIAETLGLVDPTGTALGAKLARDVGGPTEVGLGAGELESPDLSEAEDTFGSEPNWATPVAEQLAEFDLEKETTLPDPTSFGRGDVKGSGTPQGSIAGPMAGYGVADTATSRDGGGAGAK